MASSLLHKILKWTETLPLWQRDACRRLFQKDELTDNDYSDLYRLMLFENNLEEETELVPIPLAEEHLPLEPDNNNTVTLLALKNLENVNQIPNDRVLKLSNQGITLIYGPNGSGKSGYARVLKKACRARDQDEIVLPNANDPNASGSIPSAKFEIEENGHTQEVTWSQNTNSPDQLALISVFDTKCARSYTTEEKSVAYLPYGLDLLERLANQVLPKLSKLLDNNLAQLNTSTLPFVHLHGDTEVGKAIENLSAKSDIEYIRNLSVLTGEQLLRISMLQEALSEKDPLIRAEELQRSAQRLKLYSQKLEEAEKWVTKEAVIKFKKLNDNKLAYELAEEKTASNLQADDELLSGTGQQAWKELFEAARRFCANEAYPNESFPISTQGKNCPLCQDPLSQEASERLKRFDDYIKGDISKSLEESRASLGVAEKAIKEANLTINNEAALLEELDSLDPLIHSSIAIFQASLSERRSLMLACLSTQKWDDISDLDQSPRGRVRLLAAKQLCKSREFLRVASTSKKKELEVELRELQAKYNLSLVIDAVIQTLINMQRKLALENCRSLFATRSISNKSKKLASEAVTQELKDALDIELELLGIEHIKTNLKESNVRGDMRHQLILDLPSNYKVEQVLSEGEQRAIALAAFFAELSLADHSCGIVFDDPVSSLDHWRRRNVAKRLVEEAKKRQVIVFTHDTAFLGELREEIETESIPHSISNLSWYRGAPGCAQEGLPWDHQGYKQRVDALEKKQRALKRDWSPYPDENDIADIRREYDLLRATLERVIQDLVFNNVIGRYRDWVKVGNLEGVVDFSKEEYLAIDRLHTRCSNIVLGHDKPSLKNTTYPTPDELGVDIQSLRDIAVMVNERKARNKEK